MSNATCAENTLGLDSNNFLFYSKMTMSKTKRRLIFSILTVFMTAFFISVLANKIQADKTARVDFGFEGQELKKGWFQAKGSDVHANGNIASSVPATLNFMENPQGVVSYVGSTNFGDGNAPNWRVQDASIDLSSFNYDYFYHLLGSPATNFSGKESEVGDGIYYSASGLGGLEGSWKDFDKKAVILVNGDLKIDQRITLVDNGFLAFIVKGTITVDDNIGTEIKKDEVYLEGVYFAQRNFNTGSSSVPGHAKLIAKGIFVAQDGFVLGRDLGSGEKDSNVDTPAEKFIFDPGLLVKMPKAMKKSMMSWQEMAP